MLERDFKAAFLDYILGQQAAPDVIACEVPFAGARRRADFVVVSGANFHAYELKTARDNVHGIAGQVGDYQLCFPYVTAVVDAAHTASVRALLPTGVGLIVFNGQFTSMRKAAERVRLSKDYLADFLGRRAAIAMLKERGVKLAQDADVTTIRQKLAAIATLADLKTEVLSALRQRYEAAFRVFMSERGERTHPEDIDLLRLGDGSLL